MKIIKNIILSLAALASVSGATTNFVSSGSADIDRARAEIKTSLTTAENYRERSLLLFIWLGSLQQQGANTHSFFDSDQAYYSLEGKVNRAKGPAKEKAILEMGEMLKKGYQDMEEIARILKENGPIYKPFVGNPEGFPKGGDMGADWPMFQATNTIRAIPRRRALKRASSPGSFRSVWAGTPVRPWKAIASMWLRPVCTRPVSASI